MSRREWGVAGALFAAAFGLRCFYLYQSTASPFFAFPLVDAKTYFEAATNMALEGQWLGERTPFWQPPLYPYFLGLLFWTFGPGYYLPRLFQAVLGAVNCVLIYFLGRQVFSRRVGLIAAALGTVYGPLLFFEGEFLPPVLAIFLNLGLLLSLLRARSGGWPRMLATGLLLGLAALCVANILLFLPFAIGWLLWQGGQLQRAQRLGHVAVFCAGVCLAVAPVTLRNALFGDDLVLISTNAGVNFYIGNNANYKETVQIQPGAQWRALVSLPRTEAEITRPSEQSRYFFARAWEFIRTQPADYLRLLGYKTYLFWRGDEIGRNQDLYYGRNYSSLLGLLLWKRGIAFPFGVLAPLALLGLCCAWFRRSYRHSGQALLLFFLFSYTLSVILFFVSARYRLPVVPVLLLFAVWGATQLYYLAQRRQWQQLGLAGAAGLTLFWTSNFWVGEMEMEGSAHTLHRLGYVYQEKGLYANAIAAYEQALARDPTIQEARFNLGSLYAQLGRYNLAIAAYRQFIERFPEHSEAHYSLGNALLMQGNYPEAIAQYKLVCPQRAGLETVDLYGRLAYAYMQDNQPEAAEQAYRALIELKPDSLLARYQLARLYQLREMLPEARGEYEEILRQDSIYAEARYHLAFVLFLKDRPEEAKRHLHHLIAQDSTALEARWLLAKQYVVEHKAAEAMEQAQAILEIAPNHLQANRLVGHLQVIEGDTLAGVERLERFKRLHVEQRQEQLQERLLERFRGLFEF